MARGPQRRGAQCDRIGLRPALNLACSRAWASEGFFPGGHKWIFPKVFLGGPKWLNFCLATRTKKTAFFAEIFEFLPPFRHSSLCIGKSSFHTINNWCNFKRFSTVLNSETLLTLIHKIKYLTGQFQLCYCVCIGNTK